MRISLFFLLSLNFSLYLCYSIEILGQKPTFEKSYLSFWQVAKLIMQDLQFKNPVSWRYKTVLIKTNHISKMQDVKVFYVFLVTKMKGNIIEIARSYFKYLELYY